jgi:hypothetical protein
MTSFPMILLLGWLAMHALILLVANGIEKAAAQANRSRSELGGPHSAADTTPLWSPSSSGPPA